MAHPPKTFRYSNHSGSSFWRRQRNWRAPTSIREQPEYCWRPKSAETHTSSCCAGRAPIDQQNVCARERAVVHSVRTMRCMVTRSPATPDASEVARDSQVMSGAIAALPRAAQGRFYIPTPRRSAAQPAARRAGRGRLRARGQKSAPTVLLPCRGPGALPGSISVQRTGLRALVV